MGTNVNTADLLTKPLPGRAVDGHFEVRVRGAVQGPSRVSLCKTSVFPAKCRMKFDRGVFAVGFGAVSDKDQWMVRNSLPKCMNNCQDLECPWRSVDMWRTDGHCERLLRLPVSSRAHCGAPSDLRLSFGDHLHWLQWKTCQSIIHRSLSLCSSLTKPCQSSWFVALLFVCGFPYVRGLWFLRFCGKLGVH